MFFVLFYTSTHVRTRIVTAHARGELVWRTAQRAYVHGKRGGRRVGGGRQWSPASERWGSVVEGRSGESFGLVRLKKALLAILSSCHDGVCSSAPAQGDKKRNSNSGNFFPGLFFWSYLFFFFRSSLA